MTDHDPRAPRRPLALLAVGALTMSACRGPARLPTRRSPFDGATATVERGDLVGETTVQGNLRYADSYVQKSAFNGVITALPTPGTTLGQGDHVYTVAGTNAYLLHGAIPSWRSFEEGMSDGQDVVQLETALSALGYFEQTPNGHFDWNTIVGDQEVAEGPEPAPGRDPASRLRALRP